MRIRRVRERRTLQAASFSADSCAYAHTFCAKASSSLRTSKRGSGQSKGSAAAGVTVTSVAITIRPSHTGIRTSRASFDYDSARAAVARLWAGNGEDLPYFSQHIFEGERCEHS